MQTPTNIFETLVTLNALTLSAQMKASAGHKDVRAVAMISMPRNAETQISVATRYVFLLDHSGSTGGRIGESRIYQVMQKAVCGVIDLMGENDEVAVVQFDDRCTEQDVLCVPIPCTVDGKAEAQMAVNALEPSGGTTFSTGLQAVRNFFPAPAGKNSVLIFVSDGENGESQDFPIRMCGELRKAGVMVYTACVNTGGVGNSGEKLLSAMAEDKYFKSATTPQEVIGYFQTVLKASQKAAITDAVLEFRPIKSVGHTSNGPNTSDGKILFEFVEKNGTDVFVRGTITNQGGRFLGSVKVDQIGPGDKLAVHVSFGVETKPFPEGFNSEDRSFGRFVLIGSCKSLGVDNQELATCDMEVKFSANPSRLQNQQVQRIIGIADGARAKFEVSQTTDPQKQREILNKAKQNVSGTIALTGDDPTLQAVLAGLGDIEAATGKGGDAAAQKARSGTQVLRADDADAALAGL